MTASILSIGTAVPPTRLSQEDIRDLFATQPGLDRRSRRLIHAAFDASAIGTRYTVLEDLGAAARRVVDGAASAVEGGERMPVDETGERMPVRAAEERMPVRAAEERMPVRAAGERMPVRAAGERMPVVDAAGDQRMPVVDAAGRLLVPSTGSRNDAYIRHAPGLFAEAAGMALREAQLAPDEITHVVTVSCTGMFAPGPDYRLVRDLGLPVTTERYHLGFIGCAAALPGLRAAARICAGQPDAVVLVVCAELCTLHFRASTDPQQIVAASVFADGAAAAVISADPARHTGRRLDLERFGTALTDEGDRDMVWTIGDQGFEMILSAEVPRIIGREIRGAVERFLGDDGVDAWAVHPGGRSVLDRVETGLELPEDALAASRAVLHDYGNMSSATILFILRTLLSGEGDRASDDQASEGRASDGRRIAALAFGPGLTVESALLTLREDVRS